MTSTLRHGAQWEQVDSGYLLLVCLIIKLAQLRPAVRAANAALLRELADDGTVTLLYAATDRDHNNAVVLRDVLEAE